MGSVAARYFAGAYGDGRRALVRLRVHNITGLRIRHGWDDSLAEWTDSNHSEYFTGAKSTGGQS